MSWYDSDEDSSNDSNEECMGHLLDVYQKTLRAQQEIRRYQSESDSPSMSSSLSESWCSADDDSDFDFAYHNFAPLHRQTVRSGDDVSLGLKTPQVLVELPSKFKQDMEKSATRKSVSVREHRIPLELQEVFLKANRGETVTKPPVSGDAFKVFTWPGYHQPRGDSDAPTMPKRRGSQSSTSTISMAPVQQKNLPCCNSIKSRWISEGHVVDTPVRRPPRVPIELQEIFVKSNRGETVHIPPLNGVGFRVFQNWSNRHP